MRFRATVASAILSLAVALIFSSSCPSAFVEAFVETQPNFSRRIGQQKASKSTIFQFEANHRVGDSSRRDSGGKSTVVSKATFFGPMSRRDSIQALPMLFWTGSLLLSPLEAANAAPSSSSPNTGPLVESTAELVELSSGVTYRDLKEGPPDALVATEGKRVNIQWVLKRSNGYSIDSSAQNDGVPFIFVVGGASSSSTGVQTAIPGLDEGIRGMKVGGIRRIVVPPSLAYVGGLDDGISPGPVPKGFGPKQRIKRVMENRRDVPDESFLLDVKLTRVQ